MLIQLKQEESVMNTFSMSLPVYSYVGNNYGLMLPEDKERHDQRVQEEQVRGDQGRELMDKVIGIIMVDGKKTWPNMHGNRSSKNEHELKIEAVLFIYGSKSLYCH